MKLGVYTAILHDRTLREALEVIASLGLTGAGRPSAASSSAAAGGRRAGLRGVHCAAPARAGRRRLGQMGEPVHPGRLGVLEWHRRGQDLHRLEQLGAVGLMRVVSGLGDLDRHGFGDAVREGTMVVGRIVVSAAPHATSTGTPCSRPVWRCALAACPLQSMTERAVRMNAVRCLRSLSPDSTSAIWRASGRDTNAGAPPERAWSLPGEAC